MLLAETMDFKKIDEYKAQTDLNLTMFRDARKNFFSEINHKIPYIPTVNEETAKVLDARIEKMQRVLEELDAEKRTICSEIADYNQKKSAIKQTIKREWENKKIKKYKKLFEERMICCAGNCPKCNGLITLAVKSVVFDDATLNE